MNITIKSGDLLQMARGGYFDVIGHGCNCQNIMGAGIAKQIKEAFPDAFAIDKAYFNEHQRFPMMMLGTYSSFYEWLNDEAPTFQILNIYTQLYPGQNSPGCLIPLDYTALALALRKVNEEFKGKRIGLPWIGCGLAGGDKSLVRDIIENNLTDMVVTIVEYEDNKSYRGQLAGAGLGNATSSREVNNYGPITRGGADPLAGDFGRGERSSQNTDGVDDIGYPDSLSDDFPDVP